MRNIRNGLILVMTFGIIALCAVLPQIYARVQDSVSDEKVEYEDIKTVSFEKELYLTEKLFLLRDGLRVSVPEESAGKAEGDILEIVYGALEYFRSYGMLYGDWNDYNIKLEPMLFFYSDSKNTSSTFWLVEFVMDEDIERLSMWVDDETGTVLSISYETAYQVYEELQLEEFLNIFCSYYMKRLELEGSDTESQEQTDTDPVPENVSHDYYETKKQGIATAITISDEIYGELDLYFYVYLNGFFLSLS